LLQPSLMGNPEVSLSTSRQFATGCFLCFSGKKSVVFITGLCKEQCYYCPVNRDYLYRDVMKVNERFVRSVSEIPAEIARSNSSGAGITGGDPLTVPERTVEAIELLKSLFGSRFHVHLYTTGRDLTRELVRRLERAGLDELRFHPIKSEYLKKVELAAKESSIDVGIEVPSIPGSEDWILALARFLDRVGGKFLNLNELEVSPGNYFQLVSRGFTVKRGGISVEGSAETAKRAMLLAIESGIKTPIHFCPAAYKDRVQTRMRFFQTASNSAEAYEKPTKEGTLLTVSLKLRKSSDCLRVAAELEERAVLFRKGSSVYAHPDDYRAARVALSDCVEEAALLERFPDRARTPINETPLT